MLHILKKEVKVEDEFSQKCISYVERKVRNLFSNMEGLCLGTVKGNYRTFTYISYLLYYRLQRLSKDTS